ncbi:uncharacterized protein EV422DRAFT_510940 [Fimicolochytrium jonesii]|uniref:uncharacterized protein n=1 Tax=Fimicolochytrium jonesii TaxID=1396493 RepID=UPI0022FDFD24|nr:uncharacterized protein EV422DRAFT_510940 [Fimicolochytrium jonesii]KAI8826641.1 hypothetical protein EV422DRAFT_510940 [Fimicolochytrium jonesii]
MWSSAALYTNPSSSLSPSLLASPASPEKNINALIRSHFAAHNPNAILALFSQAPSQPTSSLYCIRPTRALLTSILSHCATDASEVILSIGSASGLLEYLLQWLADETGAGVGVRGVDVARTNVFLDEGTEDGERGFVWLPSGKPSDERFTSTTVLFTSYLRRPSILLDYMSACPVAHTIITVGPISEDPGSIDDNVKRGLEGWGSVVWVGKPEGLQDWERMSVWRRRRGITVIRGLGCI